MSLSKNTFQGYIGFTTTSYYGVIDIDEIQSVPPAVISTSQADAATTITLPSGITSGQTILILAASRNTIPTLSGYTLISSYSANNPKTAIYYKIADGTEGGTNLTVLSDNSVIGCIVLDKGTPDAVGTIEYSSAGTTVTASSITPSNRSLIFLCSFCDKPSNDPTNTGGFTDVVIDGANNSGSGVREFYVWSKISNGTSTGNVDVTWDTSSTATMFSMIL